MDVGIPVDRNKRCLFLRTGGIVRKRSTSGSVQRAGALQAEPWDLGFEDVSSGFVHLVGAFHRTHGGLEDSAALVGVALPRAQLWQAPAGACVSALLCGRRD